MILFKPYSNIKDFLHRFTLVKIGSLHIRLHKITDKDRTTLFHNHPFHYISIILKGGYTESLICENSKEVRSKKHNFLNIIFRRNSTFHRIDEIKGETITMFFAYGNYKWNAHNTISDNSDDGVYERSINDEKIWSKKENGIWFIGNKNKSIAINENRHSIHQTL